VDTVNCFENIRSMSTQEIPSFFGSDVIHYQQLIADLKGVQGAVHMVRVVLQVNEGAEFSHGLK
jgi:hypothetical protein